MYFKYCLVLVVIVIVGGIPIELHHQPLIKHLEYQTPAHYDFSYAVHDEHTGDIKSQQESRKGDVVQGRYELIDSDGYKRIVEYSADAHNGFNAIVHREPTHVKVPIHKVAVASPVYHHAAPVHYAQHSAPLVHQSYISPVNYHTAPIARVSYGGHAVGPSHVSYSGPGVSYQY